jgi:Bardet-Biedl syndrome 2 protein
MWINNNFILTEDFVCDGIINLAFIALRSNRPLVIRMEATGQLTFKTDDMELAGNLIQSLIGYLNLTELQVSCDFPDELENLQQVLVKVIKIDQHI